MFSDIDGSGRPESQPDHRHRQSRCREQHPARHRRHAGHISHQRYHNEPRRADLRFPGGHLHDVTLGDVVGQSWAGAVPDCTRVSDPSSPRTTTDPLRAGSGGEDDLLLNQLFELEWRASGPPSMLAAPRPGSQCVAALPGEAPQHPAQWPLPRRVRCAAPGVPAPR
jgi:hypothetical protein